VDGGDGDDTLRLAANSTGGNVTLTLGTISAIELARIAITQDGAGGGETITVVADGLESGALGIFGDGAATDIVAVTGLQAGVELTILDGDLDSDLTVALDDATGTADSLVINLVEADNVDTVVADLTVVGVETVTFVIEADEDNDTVDDVEITDLSVDGAETIVVVSEEDIDISFTDTDSLETIDLTGAVAGVDIDLNGSTDDTGVEILLANSNSTATVIAITLDATDGGSDTIVVNDSTVGAITIVNFDAGAGLVKDVIDLSAYGVTGLADLEFGGGANVTIDIDGDDSFGLITLTGVTQAQLVADNFIFA